MVATDVNSEAIEAWNTVLFEKFSRFKYVIITGLTPHGDVAIDRLAPAPGQRVLDIGCGFGDSTVALARRVGPGGEAFGVDAAANFIEAARVDARELGVENARFAAVDVQSGDLAGPYDLAYARFGTMFFDNPVAAMRNVRRALSPGGRLSMTVWRKREDNDWLHAAERAVREMVEEPEEHDQVTCGPGPFSMASADVVSTILMTSGFDRVTFERHDIPICIGRNVEEAVQFALAIGPAGEIIRLAGAEGERRRPEIIAALEGVLAGFRTDSGQIEAPSSSWIITARAA